MSKFLGTGANREYQKHLAEGNRHSFAMSKALDHHELSRLNVFLYRFVVLDVITDISSLTNGNKKNFEDKENSWKKLQITNIQLARTLPRNSIIGQELNSDEPPLFLYPFFPSHFSLPCKPGEHIWAIKEEIELDGKKVKLGYWFCKIPEQNFVDDVNHTHPPRAFEETFFPGTREKSNGQKAKYEFRPGKRVPSESNGDKTLVDTILVNTSDEQFYEKRLTESDASQIINYEAIPRYKKRPGDLALEGSNNTLIVLGTDRVGPFADTSQTTENGIKPKKTQDCHEEAGSIDIVAGRGQKKETFGVSVESTTISGSPFKKELGKAESEIVLNEGDPDWIYDKSRLLVSQRTKIDTNLKIEKINEEFQIKDHENGDASVLLKSDKIRVIGRKDVQVLVKGDDEKDVTTIVAKSSGDITIKSKNTKIKIDPSGNITMDAEGDVTLNPKGVVKLGSDSASRPCASETDIIKISPRFKAWIEALIAAVDTKTPSPAGSVPLKPVPFPDDEIGIIAKGSDKVLVFK